MFNIFNIEDFKDFEYPKKLKGSWMYFVFFEDHTRLDGICCVYFNDKFKSGTILQGTKILNDYPDIYATWNKVEEDGTMFSDRMYVEPSLRNNGLGSAAILHGAKMLKLKFNKQLKHYTFSKPGNMMWKSAFGDVIEKENDEENPIELNDVFFKQPAYPYVFFGKRRV